MEYGPKWIRTPLDQIAGQLAGCRHCELTRNTRHEPGLAGREAVCQVLADLIAVLFPGCHGDESLPANLSEHLLDLLRSVAVNLRQQAERSFKYQCVFDKCRNCNDCTRRAEEAVNRLIESLPEIKSMLDQDMVAAYEGDPAAKSVMEIVMSYPGFMAIIIHRIAHNLQTSQVPLIPRIMSEWAHAQTGIDIHPGAQIGPAFFIDHGTGVVIGETCVIGRNVKLYQGVTLGALSFPKDSEGHLIKGHKRHPNVEDDVTIYAGATILGGETTIGKGSEVGGNVWLTHSVPPFSKVYNQQPKPLIRQERKVPAAPEAL